MSQDLERLAVAVEGVNAGSVTWEALAAILAPSEAPQRLPEARKVHLATRITPGQSEALQRLTEVFGSVVPTTVRELDPEETAALFEERQVIDTVLDLVATRKENIRSTLLNHFDALNADRVSDEAPRDKDGHLLVGAEEIVGDQKFSWEISEGKPSIDIRALQRCVDKETWLGMTRQTRVFDETKAMEYIKKHPEVMQKVAEAAVPAKPRGSFNIRKA